MILMITLGIKQLALSNLKFEDQSMANIEAGLKENSLTPKSQLMAK